MNFPTKSKLSKEDKEIRQKLKLRKHPSGHWQVYTTIHGTAHFRWFDISEETLGWYKKHLPFIPTVPYTSETER